MEIIQFIGITPEEFKKGLIKAVIDTLEIHEKEKQPLSKTEYLTQEDVADLLKIGKTTVYRWTKKGRLTSYGFGNRVYYKREEINDSIIALNPSSYD